MRIDLHEFALDLVRPLATARGRMDRRSGVLVRVDDGETVGVGEATPLPGWTESLDACRDAIDRGVTIANDEGVDAALAALEDAPAARHGLSLAVADLRARRDGVSLARHLVASSGLDQDVPAHVRVNATVGDCEVEEAVSLATNAVADGFDCLKLKAGRRPLAEDVERVRRVRDAVGDDVALRVDANGAWDVSIAQEAIEGLAPLGIEYLEQPLSPDDLAGHAALGGGDVSIAIDEGLASHGPDVVLAMEAADVIVLKPMALGGLDRALDVAMTALSWDVTPVVTTTVDGVVARTAAVHLAASIPDVPHCGLATAGFLADDLGPDPTPVEAGRIRVPQTAGLGVRIADLDTSGDGADVASDDVETSDGGRGVSPRSEDRGGS